MGPTGANHPDVILLMIGTNDVNLNVDLRTLPAVWVRCLITLQLLNRMPPYWWLLLSRSCQATLRKRACSGIQCECREHYRAQHAAGQHVTLVDLYSVMNTSTDILTHCIPIRRAT